MAEFLTAAWLAEMQTAARRATGIPPLQGVTLSVRQEVTGGPAGDVAYVVRIADGTVRVTVDDTPADLTLRAAYDVARALHTGTLTAQAAIATGRLRVSGHLDRVVAAQQALASLDDVFHEVRERTTYPR